MSGDGGAIREVRRHPSRVDATKPGPEQALEDRPRPGSDRIAPPDPRDLRLLERTLPGLDPVAMLVRGPAPAPLLLQAECRIGLDPALLDGMAQDRRQDPLDGLPDRAGKLAHDLFHVLGPDRRDLVRTEVIEEPRDMAIGIPYES
jgi:hypothetical protein